MKTPRGKPRDPVKEQFWRRAIADQARSDLPIHAYCQRKGLNPRSYRSWRQELARRDVLPNEPRMRARGLSSLTEVCYRIKRL